jgi:hypothetical protein
VLVVFLSSNVHAVLGATCGEQLFLGVVMEEDIDVALNLLGGGPINLAILLQALLLRHQLIIPGPALLSALFEVDCTEYVLTPVLITLALLECFLVCIAMHVSLEEGMV